MGRPRSSRTAEEAAAAKRAADEYRAKVQEALAFLENRLGGFSKAKALEQLILSEAEKGGWVYSGERTEESKPSRN